MIIIHQTALFFIEGSVEFVGLSQAAFVGQDQVSLALGRKAAHLRPHRRILTNEQKNLMNTWNEKLLRMFITSF